MACAIFAWRIVKRTRSELRGRGVGFAFVLVSRGEPYVPLYFGSVRGFQAVAPYFLGESLDKFDIRGSFSVWDNTTCEDICPVFVGVVDKTSLRYRSVSVMSFSLRLHGGQCEQHDLGARIGRGASR